MYALAFVALAATCGTGCRASGDASDDGSDPANGSSEHATGAADTDAPEGTAIFAVKQGTPTPNSLPGVWAAHARTRWDDAVLDTRLKIEGGAITVAVRCHNDGEKKSLIAAAKSAARVSANTIQVDKGDVDSRENGDFSCDTIIRTGSLAPCSPAATSNCLELSGTSLTLNGLVAPDGQKFTKISD